MKKYSSPEPSPLISVTLLITWRKYTMNLVGWESLTKSIAEIFSRSSLPAVDSSIRLASAAVTSNKHNWIAAFQYQILWHLELLTGTSLKISSWCGCWWLFLWWFMPYTHLSLILWFQVCIRLYRSKSCLMCQPEDVQSCFNRTRSEAVSEPNSPYRIFICHTSLFGTRNGICLDCNLHLESFQIKISWVGTRHSFPYGC